MDFVSLQVRVSFVGDCCGFAADFYSESVSSLFRFSAAISPSQLAGALSYTHASSVLLLFGASRVATIVSTSRLYPALLRLLKHSITSYYIARSVVFYCLLVKANNTKFPCQLLLLFCGRFERSRVQASCRAPNLMYQTCWPSHRCSGTGGVFSSRWRCDSTPSVDTTFKKIFQNIVLKPGPLV